MRIQKVELEYFRGVGEKKEFSFEGKPFILLSAPNGLGKTTLLDSIEWCLTGNILRLKNAFDNRSTNDSERKKNVDGILRYKMAPEDAEISVILHIIDGNQEFTIRRVQTKDELNPKSSTVNVSGSEKRAKQLLSAIADQSFYNYHFCDVQKSMDIQNRKRTDLPGLFSDFITDYSRETSIANNLDLFVQDIERYKQDLEKQKIPEDSIRILQETLNQYKQTPMIQGYPQTQMFQGENVEISDADEKQWKDQLRQLFQCGYQYAGMLLGDVLKDETARSTQKNLRTLKLLLQSNKEKIKKAIEQKLHIDDQSITVLESRIKQYEEIKLTRENIWSYTGTILSFQTNAFTESECSSLKTEIQRLENELKLLTQEIETLSKGNDVLDTLSTLVNLGPGLIKYREEKQQNGEKTFCPVCGSAQFDRINQEDILRDAQDYMEQHGLLISEKKKHKDQLEKKIRVTYESMIGICSQLLKDEINKYEKNKMKLIKLQNETADFFHIYRRLEQTDPKKYTLETLTEQDNLDSLQEEVNQDILDAETIRHKREDCRKILEFLGYQPGENETERAAIQRIHESAKGAPGLISFSHTLFVQKINSLNSMLNNKTYLDSKRQLQEFNRKNTDLKVRQTRLDSLHKTAKDHAGQIWKLIDQLKADEYNKVGPNLFKFYKKLSRIHTIEKISLKQENGLLSIVDEKDKNIVNILSNGQMSVFMLAYFFAGIVSRNHQEPCKIYFIDDLTACMDDVNMLAFLDLMKYQLLDQDAVMDQIFFASCDEKICNLLRYKLKGCGVDYCNLVEADFI